MIDGCVTFHWDDGYKQNVLFFRNLKGIKHEGNRPEGYTIHIVAGIINEAEAARLNRWLGQVPAAMQFSKKELTKKD